MFVMIYVYLDVKKTLKPLLVLKTCASFKLAPEVTSEEAPEVVGFRVERAERAGFR